MKWQALVLAGERPEGDALAKAEGAPTKAFIEIAGKPMIAHVLETLSAVGDIASITVSLSPSAPALPDGPWRRIASAAGPSASVAQAFQTIGPPLLVTTADNPMMRPQTVDTFLAEAASLDATAIAGIAREETATKIEGAPQRSVMRFRDGGVNGCNLFALRTTEAAAVIAFWQRLEGLRKRPLALAAQIGPLIAARFLAGKLDLAEAKAALARKTGAPVGTVTLSDPLAPHDVDKPAHLAFARRILGAA
ncbi:MAG: NTP transferase domain-containing protein [Pseudomonadota bacterium]